MAIKQQIRDFIKIEKQENSIQNEIDFALKNKLSVVLYRLPDKISVQLIIGKSSKYSTIEALENKNGFVIQPFIKDNNLLFTDSQVSKTILLNEIARFSQQDFQFYLKNETTPSITQKSYEYYVQNSINKIETGVYKKLVSARNLIQNTEVNPIKLFVDLCEKYPNAFVSLVSTNEYGTWVGATPELLISEDDNNIRTVALAGTQIYNSDISTKQTSWGIKEIEEQALVSRYIINKFKSIRLREFEDVGPKTIKAGNLLHLKTDFLIDKKETAIENISLKLANLLHPTSAVCGMPQEDAQKFILENENLDRKLYSGFLGNISKNEINLFVNLRCVEIHKKSITFYAGAGITQESNPTKEWEETNHKINTLKSVIK